MTLVGGTMFLMWLGEQITARGIGNGISLIIFVGIIAEVPAALAQFFARSVRRNQPCGYCRGDSDGGRHHCLCGLHGDGLAQDPHPVPAPPGWHEGV